MSNETQWQGPCLNPFLAAVKALNADNVDASEFSSFGMWSCAGEYDFHNRAEDFIPSLIDFMAERWSIGVEHRGDGFYARRVEEAEEREGDLKSCPICGNHNVRVVPAGEADWVDDAAPNDAGFFVICSVKSEGCGLSSGWKPTEEEVASLWNWRAS